MEFDLLGSLAPQHPAPDPGEPPIPAAWPRCSRRGCDRPARWNLLWNNPRVHTPGRRKSWLACHEHRAYLENFLGERNFLKSVERFHAAKEQH